MENVVLAVAAFEWQQKGDDSMTPLRLTRTLCSSLIMVAAFGAPAAQADTITGTINFTVTDCPFPPCSAVPAGSFTYDQSTSTFISFTVIYDGVVYDFVNEPSPLPEPNNSRERVEADHVPQTFLVTALIITLAIAVSAQAPPVTTSDSASDPNVLTNQFIIEAGAKLPEEIIITKTQTPKTSFDLPTPALVEVNSSGVSANVLKAMMTPKNAPPRRGSHKSLTKERT